MRCRFFANGRGEFPMSMLWHDAAHPATETSAEALRGREPRSVELVGHKGAPDKHRWESFGWWITTVKGGSDEG